MTECSYGIQELSVVNEICYIIPWLFEHRHLLTTFYKLAPKEGV